MRRRHGHGKAIAVFLTLIMVAAIIGAAIYCLPGLFPGLNVLSVSRIFLYQRGVGSAGQELRGGYWRIEATTQNSEVQLLQLNETYMKEHQLSSSDFPSDVSVKGRIYVNVEQNFKPYWVIPVVPVAQNIEVSPQMNGKMVGGTAEYHTNPVTVDLWRLDLAGATVHVPFEVFVQKTLGEATGTLVPDQATLPADTIVKQLSDGSWSFDFSTSDVSNSQRVITFKNPAKPEETLKITLQWVIGDYDRYHWSQHLLFVTPPATVGAPQHVFVNPDGSPGTNTFLEADANAIMRQANWRSGDQWAYQFYWFGGGNGAFAKGSYVVKDVWGNNQAPVSATLEVEPSDGKTLPLLPGNPAPFVTHHYLSEGYIDDSSTQPPKEQQVYEYPGWFVPRYGEEGFMQNVDNWWKWRYPMQPQIYSDIGISRPYGLSFCNYLASNVQAPITGLQHTPLERRTIDVWDQGAVCDVPNPLGVAMPQSARSWVFTLDVSTELVDTVVVQQSYIDVALQGALSVSQSILAPQESATVTANLKNNSPFGGAVSVNIEPPTNLQLASSITGGSSALHFNAGEAKTISFRVTNNGNLDVETSGTFAFKVVNTEPRVTAQQTFTLTFRPGLGVPDTALDISVYDAETERPLSGINIRAEYAETYAPGTTSNGNCVIDLGKYQGQVKIIASDPGDMYKPESVLATANSGNNPVTIYMVQIGHVSPIDWLSQWWIWIVAAVAVIAVVAVAVYYAKKGKKRRRR